MVAAQTEARVASVAARLERQEAAKIETTERKPAIAKLDIKDTFKKQLATLEATVQAIQQK